MQTVNRLIVKGLLICFEHGCSKNIQRVTSFGCLVLSKADFYALLRFGYRSQVITPVFPDPKRIFRLFSLQPRQIIVGRSSYWKYPLVSLSSRPTEITTRTIDGFNGGVRRVRARAVEFGRCLESLTFARGQLLRCRIPRLRGFVAAVGLAFCIGMLLYPARMSKLTESPQKGPLPYAHLVPRSKPSLSSSSK